MAMCRHTLQPDVAKIWLDWLELTMRQSITPLQKEALVISLRSLGWTNADFNGAAARAEKHLSRYPTVADLIEQRRLDESIVEAPSRFRDE